MACCGQRVTKKKKVIVSEVMETEVGYTEGTDGYTKIAYNGDMSITVAGCKTGNKYKFGKGAVRVVDTNDAKCLFDLMPGSFMEVVEVTEVVKKTTKKQVIEDAVSSDTTEREYITS